MNVSELSKLTEDEARETLEKIMWPSGPLCCHCGEIGNTRKFEGNAHRYGVYKCNDCGKQFTVTVNTIMEESHISIRTWLMAFSLMCSSKKGVSALQLQRQLGLGSYKSAWYMAHRIREAMKLEPLASLLGMVEVDELYIGGKPRKGAGPAKRGRGTKKTPVLALVERGGRARSFPVENVSGATLKQAIRENVDRKATIMTDEWKAYQGIGVEFDGGHQFVTHSAGEYSRSDASTNLAESYFAFRSGGSPDNSTTSASGTCTATVMNFHSDGIIAR